MKTSDQKATQDMLETLGMLEQQETQEQQDLLEMEYRECEKKLLTKHDIKAVFDDLKNLHPHIHAMLMEAPTEICNISLIDKEAEDLVYFTPGKFFQKFHRFRDDDRFFVNLKGYFRHEQLTEIIRIIDIIGIETTGRIRRSYTDPRTFRTDRLAEDFVPALANWCREAMLANKPLSIGQAIVDKYALSSVDLETLIAMIDRSNAVARENLQQQYDKLKAIDCLSHH